VTDWQQIFESIPKTIKAAHGKEVPRYGIIIIDLGGNTEAVLSALTLRRTFVIGRPSLRVRVISFSANQVKLEKQRAALAAAGFGDYWKGFPVRPEEAFDHWTDPVDIIIANPQDRAGRWRQRLDAHGVWVEVAPEEEPDVE
jgi:hypothetical protein